MKINIILLLLPFLFFGQNKIRIAVVDSSNIALTRAIVVITQDDNQVAFGTTNENGILEKSLTNGSYQLRISKLGYVATNITIDIQKDKELFIKLGIEINKLETIIIKSRPKIMRVKEDTISYNIKTIVDGTERKVEDIIKKLPGLNVDANGKVSYQGEVISQVLIDGNDFFGRKHQMATQNIDAKMIEGVDLLTNYKGFSTLNNAGGSIALNLKLKDGYRNKLVGDIELSGGINDAFRGHSNLFKFAKDGNLSIISDYNTVAKTPISIDDYLEMRSSNDNDSPSNGVETIDVPSYLEPDVFYRRKNNGFLGVNYTSLLSKKSKITVSNIFNTTNIFQENSRLQKNLNNSASERFQKLTNSRTFLNNLQFKWQFNKSKITFVSYEFGLTPNQDHQTDDIALPLTAINSSIKNLNISFFQTFLVQTTILQKIKYKFKFTNSISADNRTIALSGITPFFNTDLSNINQNKKLNTNISLFQNTFSYKSNKNVFNLKTDYNLQINNLSFDIIENPTLQAFDKLSRSFFVTDLFIRRSWTSKFKTTVGLKSTLSNVSLNQTSILVPQNEPYFTTDYALSGAKRLSLSFAVNHEFPTIIHLQNNRIIRDFQILNTNSDIRFDQLIQKKELGLDYFWLNTNNENLLFSKISYSVQNNATANNIIYNMNYSENNFVFGPKNNQFRVFTLFDLKIRKIPISLKNSVSFLKSNGFNAFNGQLNSSMNESTSVNQQLFSNFKHSLLQFDLGYKLNYNKFFQGGTNFENTSNNYQIIGIVRGKYTNKIKWDVGLTRDFQNSGFNTNELYFLNANFDCQITPTLKLIINGFNLLNLKTSNIIVTSTDAVFFSESINTIMPGYAMLGLNYSF